jgi:selenocysteine-specific elongation factor
MSHLIVGTAGHVDHGKTTLIRALTGINTDRLKEEQERGMSIELGFAHFQLPSGRVAGIVDVPGHERFVKNMLAGAAGMDVVLLVIAADEGIMPQTREHLDILQLLEAKKGIVVLTKADLVEEEWIELVQEDVRAQLAETFLKDAPIVPVSAPTGRGLKELALTIDAVCAQTPAKDASAAFRLPVDRSFIIEGFGAVVTGTAIAGRIRVGELVEILPKQLEARVRNLEVHGKEVEIAEAGQRVALNLSGVSRGDVERGHVVAARGSMQPTTMIDVKLHLLRNAKLPLKDGGQTRLYLGTAEYLPYTFLLEKREMKPGETGYVQFRFDAPMVCARGDRFVIRSYSPLFTIGGGIVLEPHAKKHRRFHEATLRELKALESAGDVLSTAETVLRRAGAAGVTVNALRQSLATTPEATAQIIRDLESQNLVRLGGGATPYLHRAIYDDLCQQIISILDNFHRKNPLRQGMPREQLRAALPKELNAANFDALLAALQAEQQIAAERDIVRRAGFVVTFTDEQKQIADRLERAYRDGGFSSPDIGDVLAHFGPQRELANAIFYSLVDAGKLVRVADLVFHESVLERAKQIMTDYIRQHGKMTVAEFRNLTDSSRKYAVPLLEHFDKIGFTRRVGDERVLREQRSS